MSNPSKQKGTAFVRSLLPALQTLWPAAEARAQHGALDRGDIVNTGRLTIECKCEKKIDLAGWWREAQIEARNAKTELPVVIFKRRGTQTAEYQWVLMNVATLLKLLT